VKLSGGTQSRHGVRIGPLLYRRNRVSAQDGEKYKGSGKPRGCFRRERLRGQGPPNRSTENGKKNAGLEMFPSSEETGQRPRDTTGVSVGRNKRRLDQEVTKAVYNSKNLTGKKNHKTNTEKQPRVNGRKVTTNQVAPSQHPKSLRPFSVPLCKKNQHIKRGDQVKNPNGLERERSAGGEVWTAGRVLKELTQGGRKHL